MGFNSAFKELNALKQLLLACNDIRLTLVTPRNLGDSVGKTSYCIIDCSSDAGMLHNHEVTLKVVRGRINAATNDVA